MAVHDTRLRSSKDWFTLATESEMESESEAQGALRSSVNQKSKSEAESEGSEDFRCFRCSENWVNGIGIRSKIISQSKNSLPVPFKLRARQKWRL